MKPDIILFHYTVSPYARRVHRYLMLRGLKYSQCLQPPILPRPDLEALGVQYRRIPILAIGNDIYCDSHLIIRKLEILFPEGKLGANNGDGMALENLLEKWATGLSRNVVYLIPENPFMSDPKFIADRIEFGFDVTKRFEAGRREEAMLQLKIAFDFMETTLLMDGREWVQKTAKASLADIQVLWVFDWVVGLEDTMDSALISAQTHPKVFAWVARFRKALSTAPVPQTLTGKDVLDAFSQEKFAEPEGTVDPIDPLQLQKGDAVLVFPTDTGSSKRDSGTLLALNAQEVVLQRKTEDQRFNVRLHFPRTNFRIIKATAENRGLL